MAGFLPSASLQALLAELTKQQARGVIRIIEEVELGESTIEALLTGPKSICAYTTYYKADGGWAHNPKFQTAIEQAKREIRDTSLREAIDRATEELRRIAPLAAQDLGRQIIGDVEAIEVLAGVLGDKSYTEAARMAAAHSLGQIGTKEATLALMAQIPKAEGDVHEAVIAALGASAAGANMQRRLADVAALDRADLKTASKADNTGDNEALTAEAMEAIRKRRWQQVAPALARALEEAAP